MNRPFQGREFATRLALLALLQMAAAVPGVWTVSASAEDRSVPERGEEQIEDELRFNRAVVRNILGDAPAALNELPEPVASETAPKYYRGILLLKLGEIAEATQLLEEILPSDDAPPATAVYLAVAYLHGDRPYLAESVIRGHLAEHPRDDYVRYLLSVSLAQQETSGDGSGQTPLISQANYQESIGPGQPYAIEDGEFDFAEDPVDYRSSDRNWSLSVLLAHEYDSNVPLAPDFIGLGSNSVEREDARAVVATFGELLLFERPDVNFGLVGSTFDSFQFDLEEFNLQDYMGGAFANTVVGNCWILGVRYEFHETLFDDNHFADEHRLTPNLTYMGWMRGHTTFFYEYDRLDSNAPALIPAQFLSANVNSVGVTQAIYTFDGQGRIYAGYRFAHANADGSDFERTTHMVTGRFEVPLDCCRIVDAEVRYFWDDYPNPNSLDFFERPRKDERIEVRVGYQRNYNAPWSLRLEYAFIDNNSSVENLFGVRFYEYARHVISTQLIYSF